MRTAAAAEKITKAIAPWPRNDNASTIKAQIKIRPTNLRRPSVVRVVCIGRLLPEFLFAELCDIVDRFMATTRDARELVRFDLCHDSGIGGVDYPFFNRTASGWAGQALRVVE